MHRYSNTAKLLRWSAWTSGTVVALFLLYMLIGHLVGEANGPDPWTFGSTRDLLSFLLFPLLTLIGLLLAYRWTVIGGTLCTATIVLLLLIRPDLLRSPIPVVAIPGVLYLLYAWYTRRARPAPEH